MNTQLEYLKDTCRYCSTKLPDSFLELGSMALANSYLNASDVDAAEFECPLSLVHCPNCHLIQLSHVVPADLMFKNYLYVSSTTRTFQKHFAEYAESVRNLIDDTDGGIAVDIGSNDGLLVDCYQKVGFKSVGIDPAVNLAEAANRAGRETINAYFGKDPVDQILGEKGQAHVISGNNVFAHIDDIDNVLTNVKRLMHPKGLFVIEFPYLRKMLDELLFDMIYHEHLSYISLVSLTYVLAKHDLEIFKIHEVKAHGGSLRVFMQHKGGYRPIDSEIDAMLMMEKKLGYEDHDVYKKFADQVRSVRETLIGYVRKLKKESGSVAGYGAPAKGNTLINYCGWSGEDLDYLVDDNPLKQNMLAPGSKLPIVSSQFFCENPTDNMIIFAWNFAEEIMKKIQDMSLNKDKIQFIVPLPKPKII